MNLSDCILAHQDQQDTEAVSSRLLNRLLKLMFNALCAKEKAVRYITYYNGTNHNAASSSGSRCSNICF